MVWVKFSLLFFGCCQNETAAAVVHADACHGFVFVGCEAVIAATNKPSALDALGVCRVEVGALCFFKLVIDWHHTVHHAIKAAANHDVQVGCLADEGLNGGEGNFRHLLFLGFALTGGLLMAQV